MSALKERMAQMRAKLPATPAPAPVATPPPPPALPVALANPVPPAAPAAPVVAKRPAFGSAKPKAKAKTDKPELETNETINDLLKQYFILAEDAKSNKEMADLRRDDVWSLIKPAYYEACEQARDSISSVNVGDACIKTSSQYIVQPGSEEILASVFGADYSKYIKEEKEISIKKESANDDTFLQQLIDLLGADFCARHFVEKPTLKVTPALHMALHTDPAFRAKAQALLDHEVIKQYKPSIALR